MACFRACLAPWFSPLRRSSEANRQVPVIPVRGEGDALGIPTARPAPGSSRTTQPDETSLFACFGYGFAFGLLAEERLLCLARVPQGVPFVAVPIQCAHVQLGRYT